MDDQYRKKFGDIWLRARHNAIANLIAAEKAAKCLFWTEVLVAILIIIPIASAILSKQFYWIEKWDLVLTVFGSLGALFFTLIGSTREKQRMENYHRRAHMYFNNIAQKARRGDILEGDDNEQRYLIRSLEEMFETAKNNSYEPKDEDFYDAFKRILNMPKLPFNLTHEELKKNINVFKCK